MYHEHGQRPATYRGYGMEARRCTSCGNEIRDEYGDPVFNKYFCKPECRAQDKAARVRRTKAKAQAKKEKREQRDALRDARAAAKRAPKPLWVTINGTRIGLSTARGALLLAQKYPEIVHQVSVEPVKTKRKGKQ